MSTEGDGGSRLFTDEELQELSRLGQAIYERLRPDIEPGHAGEFVAIHVDTGEYAIGRTATDARRALRARQDPCGRMHTQKIGDEPDYALAARWWAGQLASGGRK